MKVDWTFIDFALAFQRYTLGLFRHPAGDDAEPFREFRIVCNACWRLR